MHESNFGANPGTEGTPASHAHRVEKMYAPSPARRSSGLLVGILPGAGGDVASWVSYNEAKRFSRNPDNFGKGEIEGVAASETANNAVTGGAMIPLLTLGIPGSAAIAVMLGGLLIHGLQPGHELFTNNGHIIYAVIVGLIIANVLMGLFGLLMAKHVVKVATVPFSILAPVIIVLSVVGYTINNNMFRC